MRTKEDKLRRRQLVLGWTFVGSSTVFLLSIPFVLYLSYFWGQTSGISKGTATTTTSLPLLALLVSITSLIGFVLTSVLSIRREARDVQSYKLDLEKKALEIEKLKIELEKIKQGDMGQS